MPIWITPSLYLSKPFSYQTATHCHGADWWLWPIAAPTNWNQLHQQAVSWDSWQRYEGLDWASPVQQGPAGEEGWVLHHWSRVTVMDRFREESWWPRFFSCLDSVWKDGHDGRKASKSNRACVYGVCVMSACSRLLMWVCMHVKWSGRGIHVKSDTEIWKIKPLFMFDFRSISDTSHTLNA